MVFGNLLMSKSRLEFNLPFDDLCPRTHFVWQKRCVAVISFGKRCSAMPATRIPAPEQQRRSRFRSVLRLHKLCATQTRESSSWSGNATLPREETRPTRAHGCRSATAPAGPRFARRWPCSPAELFYTILYYTILYYTRLD